MIRDIKKVFNIKQVYEIYALCRYFLTMEEFNAIAIEYINDTNTNIYGFYNDATLMGMIIIRNNTDRKAEIVGPNYQNKGIGRKLIEYALYNNDIIELFAETDDDAIEFYNKCGFKTEEIYITYNGNKIKRYKCNLLIK